MQKLVIPFVNKLKNFARKALTLYYRAVSDVADREVFNVEDFKEFHIKLHNWTGKVIDFADFVKNRKVKS